MANQKKKKTVRKEGKRDEKKNLLLMGETLFQFKRWSGTTFSFCLVALPLHPHNVCDIVILILNIRQKRGHICHSNTYELTSQIKKIKTFCHKLRCLKSDAYLNLSFDYNCKRFQT